MSLLEQWAQDWLSSRVLWVGYHCRVKFSASFSPLLSGNYFLINKGASWVVRNWSSSVLTHLVSWPSLCPPGQAMFKVPPEWNYAGKTTIIRKEPKWTLPRIQSYQKWEKFLLHGGLGPDAAGSEPGPRRPHKPPLDILPSCWQQGKHFSQYAHPIFLTLTRTIPSKGRELRNQIGGAPPSHFKAPYLAKFHFLCSFFESISHPFLKNYLSQ